MKKGCQPLTLLAVPSLGITYLLTYLLRGAKSFLRKVTGFQLIKEFLTFYGTWKFITADTSARHLSLSWAMNYILVQKADRRTKVDKNIN